MFLISGRNRKARNAPPEWDVGADSSPTIRLSFLPGSARNQPMKQKLYNALGILFLFQVFLITGCASIDKDADPVVVHAERTTAYALDIMDAFLKFEYDNRERLQDVSKDIKKYADVIRKNGKQWLTTARELTMAYKQNRTADKKFELMTAISVLQAAVSESQKYIAMGSSNP